MLNRLKIAALIATSLVTVLFAEPVQAGVIDFNTSTLASEWSIVANGQATTTLVNTGGGISPTSPNTAGYWTATFDFYLQDTNDAALSFSQFYADDRAVLVLNGTIIGATGVYAPGTGSFQMVNGGPLESYYFPTSNGSDSGTVVTGFVEGLNTLTIIVNNTGNGIYGASTSSGGPTGAMIQGSISYIPEPSSFTLIIEAGLLALGAAPFRRRRRFGSHPSCSYDVTSMFNGAR